MVTQPWDQIVKQALLGVERDASAGEDAEKALLDAAALTLITRDAGRLPDDAQTPRPEICAPEDQRYIGARAVAHGTLFLYEPRHRELLPEWLDGVANADRCLPPRLLPAILEAGRHHPKLAERVRAVIGERGRWLARHNEAWRYALALPEAPDLEAFEAASAEEQIRQLEGWRKIDPAGARASVEKALPGEKARVRTALVETLRTGLTMDDEPFLESCLDDKSKEVRRAAARLLGRLPESRRAKRMIERALQLVRVSSEGWEVTLPTAIDEAMLRDGIVEPDSSADGFHWCLTQILEATPPTAYEAAFERNAPRLVAALLRSEQRNLLAPGFASAAKAYGADDWLEALIFEKVEEDGALWSALPAERREALFLRVLKRATSHLSLHRALFHLPKVDGPWNVALSKQVVAAIGKLVASEERLGEFPAFNVLRDAGRKLAPSSLPAVKQLVMHISERSYWKKSLIDCLEALERRAAMTAALQEDE